MGKKKRSKNKPPTEQSPEQAQEQGTPPMADEPASPAAPLTQPAPEQQVGDTPAKPWEMPTAEQKAEVKPVRRALREALAEVDSPEKAEQVVGELKAAAAGQTTGEVAAAQPTPANTAEAAEQVAAATQAAPPGHKATEVLAETARVISTAHKPEREAVGQAVQEVFNAQQQGAEPLAPEQEQYLRQALLHQLKPLDAFDAELFLKINHLPHTPALNRFFYFFTFVFTGGAAWFALMGVVALLKRPVGWRMVREAALPLALATVIVEQPVKAYFRRKRPFITIIQAIVIGKKPGTWSFPSGHSAAAFAGAWLFSRYLPRLRGLWYTLASIVAFSRIYLGDHYPGDVVSGSVLGVLLASLLRRVPWPWLRRNGPDQGKPGGRRPNA